VTDQGEGLASEPEPSRRVEISESRGFLVGDGNVQINFMPGGNRSVGPVVVGNVPQSPLAFQPREDLLGTLRATGSGTSVVYAVTGLRGVGKTQAAAAYARECINARWRLVAWVNAEDLASALTDLAVVASRLGIRWKTGIEEPGQVVRSYPYWIT
jgi:hypothetical protein